MILMMLFFRSTDNGQQSTDKVHFCNIFQLSIFQTCQCVLISIGIIDASLQIVNFQFSIFNWCEPWAVSYGLLLSSFYSLHENTFSKVQLP